MKHPIEKGGFPLPWLVYWRAHISTTVKLPFKFFASTHPPFKNGISVSMCVSFQGQTAFAERRALLNFSLAFSTASIPGARYMFSWALCHVYSQVDKCNIKRWSENKESTPIFFTIVKFYKILNVLPAWVFQFFWGWFSNSSVLVDASHQTEVTSAWLDLSASFTSASTLATWLDWYHKTPTRSVGGCGRWYKMT